MIHLGKINGRNIFYQKFDYANNWHEILPKENWLAFVITSGKSKPVLSEIADILIDNNACYISCTGQHGELLHDITDETIVERKVYGMYFPPFDLIITTWDENTVESFWASIYASNNEPHVIDTIVCLDDSETGLENELANLVKKFSAGYIPE